MFKGKCDPRRLSREYEILRPENGGGRASQANREVREEYSMERQEHVQRPRGRRQSMVYRMDASGLLG